MAPPAAAATGGPASSFAAPGLTSGPVLTSSGIAWTSPRGILLSGAGGAASLLAPPGAGNWNGLSNLSWFGTRWWAQARPDGVFGGTIGGALRRLPALARCNPATSNALSAATGVIYAVSGEHLYAAQPAACFTGRASPQGRVLDVDLRTGHARLLATLPGTPIDLSAAGRYLAVAISPLARGRGGTRSSPVPVVRLLDSASGKLLGQTEPPLHPSVFSRRSIGGVQVDGAGDILVNAGCCGGEPDLAQVAQPLQVREWWWAPRGSKTGRTVALGTGAVLSGGRVASSEEGSIELTDLRTGSTRTAVRFTGTLNQDRLAFANGILAWSQVSSVFAETDPHSCETVLLGPQEIAEVDLARLPAAGIVLTGLPVPARYEQNVRCVMPLPL